MKASEIFGEPDIRYCHVCGYIARGHMNKNRKWVSSIKVLAGHIMASRTHKNKKWALEIIREVKT